MNLKIAFLSQKGGCGKSTLARLFAQQFIAPGVRQAEVSGPGDLTALIADMDYRQGTSARWAAIREREGLKGVRVVPCTSVEAALKAGAGVSALVFDGAPYASAQTLEIARAVDLTVIPTGPSPDDLHPNVLLAHELVQAGLDRECIRLALFRVDKDAPREIAQAVKYIHDAGYQVFVAALADKPSYRRALEAGRSPAETINPATGNPYEGLNAAAIALANEIAAALLDQ